MVFDKAKVKMGRKVVKAMKTQFKGRMDEARELALKGDVTDAKRILLDEIGQGLDIADGFLNNPCNVEEEELQEVLKRLDYSAVDHKPTQNFLQKLSKIEGNDIDSMMDLINDFEKYYLEALK